MKDKNVTLIADAIMELTNQHGLAHGELGAAFAHAMFGLERAAC